MSISRVTSLSRLLSNNETLTIRVSARKAAAALAVTCFAAGVWAGVALQPAYQYVREQLVIRRDQKAALRPWMEQARATAATYAGAKPGDMVFWCIDNPGKGVGMLDGSGAQPLLLVGDFPIAGGTTGGRCVHSLAKVVSREPQGLKLEFVGRP